MFAIYGQFPKLNVKNLLNNFGYREFPLYGIKIAHWRTAKEPAFMVDAEITNVPIIDQANQRQVVPFVRITRALVQYSRLFSPVD